MASASISNIQYEPAAYVEENGGSLFFSWDVFLDCTPDPLPGTFVWTLRLLKPDGSQVGTLQTRTEEVAGSVTHVEYIWDPPPIPEEGVRPSFTVSATCIGEITVNYCTGIHKIKKYTPIGASGTGPRICGSCQCLKSS
jgi:hypothetical protein